MPGVLVRYVQEPATLSGFHAAADEVHQRPSADRGAIQSGESALSAMRRATAADARYRASVEIHLLAMRAGARTVHRICRFPTGERFHPSALGAADQGIATERADSELLELWRAHRSGGVFGVRALRIAAVIAGHEAAAADVAGAERGRGASG